MDLINREAAIDSCIEVSKQEEEHSKMWANGLRYAKKILTEVPSVPAVPLDKLCEWLSENSIIIPCKSCPNLSNDYCAAIRDTSIPCPKTADDWRRAITKWMEEQDAAD